MNIINAAAEYIQPSDIFRFTERIGRTCYKSEDKITNESAVKFVKMLIRNHHTAMLEHAHLYFLMNTTELKMLKSLLVKISERETHASNQKPHLDAYLNITYLDNEFIDEPSVSDPAGDDHKSIITGSLRAFIDIIENVKLKNYGIIQRLAATLARYYPALFDEKPGIKCLDMREFTRQEFILFVETYCNKSIHIHKNEIKNAIFAKHLPHTVKFTCDRGVSHELVRHRPASFAQESTRYCNYAHEKFGKEITVIRPCFWNEEQITNDDTENTAAKYLIWKTACEYAETCYFKLLEMGAKPQEARDVLPNSTKTEIIITATESEWQHIINLRYIGTTGAPHPQMREIMSLIMPDLKHHSEYRLTDQKTITDKNELYQYIYNEYHADDVMLCRSHFHVPVCMNTADILDIYAKLQYDINNDIVVKINPKTAVQKYTVLKAETDTNDNTTTDVYTGFADDFLVRFNQSETNNNYYRFDGCGSTNENNEISGEILEFIP